MKLAIIFSILFPISIILHSQNEELLLGADLSYTMELEDHGAIYTSDGAPMDPFILFSEKGSSLARFRLWHTPDWKNYCDEVNKYGWLNDVILSMQRAKSAGMKLLLCPHYSDNWADPSKQHMPSAWRAIDDFNLLLDSAYRYTFDLIKVLNEKEIVPDFFQIGNETNNGFIDQMAETTGMDWERHAQLFNTCIRAVRDAEIEFGLDIEILIHVAQPENTDWWLNMATVNGITDFDVIGLSYYPKWSTRSLSELGQDIEELRINYQKEIMIVETAYPWTLDFNDQAHNILGEDSTLEGFPLTGEGQKDFLLALSKVAYDVGAMGIVYWEPAWVSTPACTQWGEGSHWENASFFDFEGEALPAFEFYSFDGSVSTNNTLFYSSVIYPNPASDMVNIELEEASEILLLNLDGKILQKARSRSIQWNINYLLPGTYIIYIKNGTSVELRKLAIY